MTTSSEKEMWRLFVAIPLPHDVKTAIDRTQSLIRQHAAKEGVGWTRPEQFHLTLKFLGDASSDSVPGLINALRLAAEGFGPLALRLEGLGFFPNARVPRVLWAGITDSSHLLKSLQAEVEKACAEFTAEPPENRFHAHVTLGRVKRFRGEVGDDLANAVAPYQAQEFGSWTATHLDLIRSQLSSAGPTYTTLAELRFMKA
jgi:2'-5' RNA ligase